jgi:Concanavalin A-like lectin/glucanases superfamily
MSTQYSPKIVTNGLVLALDSGNTKSIPLDPTVNLKSFSQDFTSSGANYGFDNITATTSFLAPDRTSTATLFTETTASAVHRLTVTDTSFFGMQQNKYYTLSFSMKSNGRTRGDSFFEFPSGRAGVFYDLSAGTVTQYSLPLLTSSITPEGDGWYRISYTCRETASLTPGFGLTIARFYNEVGNGSYTGNGLSGSYFWGVQVEQNTYQTAYTASVGNVLGKRTSWTNLTNLSQTASLLTGSISASIPQFSSLGSGILNFDGTGSYANTGLDLRWGTGSSVSIEMWLKNGLSSTSGPFIGTTNYMWQIRQGLDQSPSTAITYIYWDNTGNHTNGPVLYINNFFDGGWKHLTMTWDSGSSTTSLYKNGVLQTAQTSSNPAINRSVADTVKLGGNIYGWGTGTNWSGSIANVKIYNRTLTPQEILQNYNATKTRFGL